MANIIISYFILNIMFQFVLYEIYVGMMVYNFHEVTTAINNW